MTYTLQHLTSEKHADSIDNLPTLNDTAESTDFSEFEDPLVDYVNLDDNFMLLSHESV